MDRNKRTAVVVGVAARFHLVEVSVPPGAATLEKLAALTPGVADRVVDWAQRALHWMSKET